MHALMGWYLVVLVVFCVFWVFRVGWCSFGFFGFSEWFLVGFDGAGVLVVLAFMGLIWGFLGISVLWGWYNIDSWFGCLFGGGF